MHPRAACGPQSVGPQSGPPHAAQSRRGPAAPRKTDAPLPAAEGPAYEAASSSSSVYRPPTLCVMTCKRILRPSLPKPAKKTKTAGKKMSQDSSTFLFFYRLFLGWSALFLSISKNGAA